MRESLRTGITFGMTSGVITTLGLMVGLHAGTQSQLAVIGGIVVIAIADAMSDALGIHISEESENIHKPREIWEATFSTLFTKLVLAMTFVLPVLFLELQTAILVSVLWGLAVLSVLSFSIAKACKKKAWNVVAEHIFIALLVITITHYVGDWVGTTFG